MLSDLHENWRKMHLPVVTVESETDCMQFDQADEPTPAEPPKAQPKKRHESSKPEQTPAELLNRIFAAEGFADKLERGNASQRNQAAAVRRSAKELRKRYDVLNRQPEIAITA